MESQIWCLHSVALCEGGLKKGTMPLPVLWSFVLEEAVPEHTPWCQTLQLLHICHWCPSSFCSHGGTQREWVCLSPKPVSGPLRGGSWESQFLPLSQPPTGFYSQKLWGLIFLVLEPWAGLSSVGLGFLAQEISLLTFIHHTWVCDCHSNLWTSVPLYVSLPSYLSGWMWHLYFLGCWTSIQPDFLSILGDTCFVV